MTQTVTTRIATAADNILLAELGRRTFADTFAADNTPEDMEAYLTSAFGPEIQAEKLADPNYSFIVADIDGTAAGYAQLHLATPPEGVRGTCPIELCRIYADTGWIGQGVGATLMRACLTQAVEKECDTIWLSVWERNAHAIAFYEKWGFEKVGTQGFWVGSDLQTDWLMLRNVGKG